MRVLLNSIRAVALSGFTVFPSFASAQCPGTPAAGSLQSTGIQAQIVSAVPIPAGNNLALTIEVRNLTENTAHVMFGGNLNIANNSGGSFIETRAVGLNVCRFGSDDKISIDHCVRNEASNMNNYNDLNACDAIKGTVYFNPNANVSALKNGDLLNYTLRMIVRFTPPNNDPLRADGPATPARIVTLNFPPIPVHAM